MFSLKLLVFSEPVTIVAFQKNNNNDNERAKFPVEHLEVYEKY